MRIESTNKEPESKTSLGFVLIILAVISALFFAGILKAGVFLLILTFQLIKEYWMFVLIGLGVLLILRKLLFRKKVQDVRVVGQ